MSPPRNKDSRFECHRIDSFTKGWFVGNFNPTLIPSDDVEVAVKYYKAGDHDAKHHHKVGTEITAIVSGRVKMSGEEFTAGDVIKISPGQSTDFTALTDATTVVVKMPCVTGDKYLD